MNRLRLSVLLLALLGSGWARAQVPAIPADPNQPRPAQPVEAVPIPVAPAPATPATTNAVATPPPAPPAGPQVTVLADSSLKAVLQELAQTWADSLDTSPQVPITLTNAGTMRAKIEAGAVWDVVIDADIDDVKAMTDKGLLLAEGQHSLARNTLVIYGRKALVKDDELDWFDLVGTEWKKVALGDPLLTVSGRVAERALKKHDLLGDDHKDVYVHAGNEIAALHVAEREQADAVFVYRTDLGAVNIPGFEPVTMATEDAPPIFYTVAVQRFAPNPVLAKAFIDYCSGDSAKAIWAKYGFETN